MTSTVLVGGGAGALGAAVTEAFLTAGWRVVVPVRHEGDALTPHERLRTVPADLFEPASAAEVAAAAADDPDAPLRAVVNLVGGFAAGGRVHETGVADFEQQLRLNLRPTYLTTHAVLPHMVAAGGGAIVCASSRAALKPFPGAAGYLTAKAAVLAFVDCLAVEYAKDDVRANAILPGVIDTPANRAAMPDADRTNWVPPTKIAEVIRFLCEDASTIISGARVPV